MHRDSECLIRSGRIDETGSREEHVFESLWSAVSDLRSLIGSSDLKYVWKREDVMWKERLGRQDLIDQADSLKSSPFKPGCDDMSAKSAALWMKINADRLLESLREGRYQPMPVSGFRVAKSSGSFRTLTRVTAIDMIVQRCLLRALEEECETGFSDHSYAYRIGRGMNTALEKYCEYGSAYRFVAKIDPKDCFGSMDFDVLESALTDFFGEDAIVQLLMSFARTPILEDGEIMVRSHGIPQGAPLSPLLCNVYMHRLDRYIESMGIPFIRYADDVVLFANSRDDIRDVSRKVQAFFHDTLKLEINRKKYQEDSPFRMQYLGHRFAVDREGILVIDREESLSASYHAWHTRGIRNPGRTMHILSDGILRQKDLSMLLESETGKYDIPVKNTDCINIFSSVVFDSGFLSVAARHGIPVNLFDRHGHLQGTFVPAAPLRAPRTTFEQLQAYYDEEHRLELAKSFVLASIHNLRIVIRHYHKKSGEPFYQQVLDEINLLEMGMKSCRDYQDLLMKEARVRAAYYSCYDHFCAGKGFHFERRSRRPPLNPLNALLSFGNTVLYSYLATEIHKSVLDVRIGCLHATNKRMESLNLDLAELFKPLIVDRTVFTLINRRQLKADIHFTDGKNGGVYLNAEGKRIFLEGLNEKLHDRLTVRGVSKSYLEIMAEEVRKLVRHFRSGEKYVPYKQVR